MEQPQQPPLNAQAISAAIGDRVLQVPNLPMVNQAQAIQALTNQFEQLDAQLNVRFNQVNETLNTIREEQQRMENLLPLLLYNSSISYHDALRLPPGIPEGGIDLIPRTKAILMEFTIAQCIDAALVLGLPPLAGIVTVHARRQQLADHLGCAMLF